MKSKFRVLKKLTAVICAVSVLTAFSSITPSAVGLEDYYLIGDVNMDGEVNIVDATLIQKHISLMKTLGSDALKKADTNYDKEVNIQDATHIQKIISKMYIPLTAKKGVDISKHNGDVDINKIKAAGYDFVMIRCGFGDDYESQDDKLFETNVKKCEKAGMPWGVYLYSYALTVKEAQSEVAHTLRLLKGKKPTLPVAFDMEDADGYKSSNGMPSDKNLVKICKTYLKGVKDAGYYPILYASLSWLNGKLNDSSLLDNYDIWLAQWNDECTYKGKTLGIWQYGGSTNYIDGNSIAGVGVIDKNFCYKDYPLLIKNQHYNGW